MLEILYKDAWLVAVNKPAGLLVHRTKLDTRATRFLLQELRDQLQQHVYPVHRLDRPTSGVMLFGLNSDTARALAEQFEQRQTRKMYHALVRGYAPQSGHIDHALKEELDRIADANADQDKAAQEASTSFERLAISELDSPVGRYPSARYSLVKLLPHTGRKHQLRRHMAHINHPIVGDVNHGDNKHNKFFKQQLELQGLFLHATALEFCHPHTDSSVNVFAPFSVRWQQMAERLAIELPQFSTSLK